MGAADRILTIVVTATVTSAVWIVAGSSLLDNAREASDVPSQEKPAAEIAMNGVPEPARPGPAPTTRTAGPPAGGVTQSMVQPSGLIIPVKGVTGEELVDTFTDSRGGGARVHEAIDIMAPTGTPVQAASAGKVEKLFLSDAGGKTVYVRSLDGKTIYYYAHLDTYAPNLKEGQDIAQGAAIGTVGSTGNASADGPHLHFAIMRTAPDAQWWEASDPVDPYPLLGGK